MATYAIGDIQGCNDELQRLLDHIHFDPGRDHLWLVGDLVNRGPDSLAVLRFIKSLDDRAITVLGNHDLHTLAVANGHLKYHRNDNIDDILHADDRDELTHWLRNLPLLHHDASLNFTMIHAGLPPQWNLETAQACANEVEAILKSDTHVEFLDRMYGNEPDIWNEELEGWDRLRFITNCFSRLRYCDADGKLALEEKGSPGSQASDLMPWFEVPNRKSEKLRIVFGHWSTLGPIDSDTVYPIDTGCLWGDSLTALRLDDCQSFSIQCPQIKKF